MTKDVSDMPIEKLFHELIKKLHHKRREKLEQLGLYRGQPPILFTLYEKDGKTQKEIAEVMKIQASTVTKMIQRMEKSGFITRKNDENDKRVMRVYLTDKGKEIESKLREVMKEIGEKTFVNISFEEKIILKRVFMQMYDNLED